MDFIISGINNQLIHELTTNRKTMCTNLMSLEYIDNLPLFPNKNGQTDTYG